MIRRLCPWTIAVIVAALFAPDAVAQERANRLISLLEAGKPAIGVWTAATAAPRITKVLATSDADYIVADIEHEVYDFAALRGFLLGVQDFSLRFRTDARSAPVVLVKLANRATWDPRYEIAESLKVGPAMGVWIPFVESRADLERAISAVRNAETSALAGLNIPRERRDVWPLNPKGELLVVAMIETENGVRNAKEIVETPGVSAVECVHIPEADAARILKMCLDRKVVAAIDVTPADVQAKIAAGYRMLSVGWDYALLQRALTDTVKAMRK
ncbi:MAG: aldolase/citrate lyase family protein [Acidobacteria bacterium]|jgi:2-keto-3-deoxy-L-rhamnonate aldolase RhmA|nr:aldolase/citrate lyase family protein [Acidobacteriota bacterium]